MSQKVKVGYLRGKCVSMSKRISFFVLQSINNFAVFVQFLAHAHIKLVFLSAVHVKASFLHCEQNPSTLFDS